MTTIKICDVRDPDVAAFCAEIGVSMVGLHCIWEPPSESKLENFRSIKYAIGERMKCVLVTRQTDISTVIRMTEDFDWDYLQLHAIWEKAQLNELRTELARRGKSPGLIGVIETSSWDAQRVFALESAVELLLFDSTIRGGSGSRSDIGALRNATARITSKPFLIAGGLRADNVAEILRVIRPWGVDVQSGVEKSNGSRQKDITLIRQFVEVVRSTTH